MDPSYASGNPRSGLIALLRTDAEERLNSSKNGPAIENAASVSAPEELAPRRATCADPSEWEDYDGMVCGACTALVDWDEHGRTCRGYCDSIGLACADGWEEHDDNCDVKCRIGCDGTYGTTSDAICQCSDSTEGAPPNHYYECGSGKGKGGKGKGKKGGKAKKGGKH